MAFNRTAICTGIVVLALTSPLAANAGIKSSARSVRVDISNLNLQAHEGQETVYAKLRNAARSVCGAADLHRFGSLDRFVESKQCYEDSLDRAVEKIDNEGVSRLHRES